MITPIQNKGEGNLETIEKCKFLTWDTNFFGKKIARATVSRMDKQTAEVILEWCQINNIECLYFLADSNHAETVKVAEDYDFRLVDIRITLQRHLRDEEVRVKNDLSQTVAVRPSRPCDISELQAIARISYYHSRYYFDPCFSTNSCQALYETWIKRSCSGYANMVLVAEMNGKAIGYVSCHLMNDTLGGQIGLVGVASGARGRGVGKTLIDHCLDWFATHGCELVKVVTQGRNIAAQRLYQSCGFLTHSVELWYHKWLSDCG